MGKHSRHYTDLNPLEGGGSGGGGGFGRAMEKHGPIGLLVGSGAAGYADYKSTKNRQQEEREAAAEMKRESRDREESMTPGQKQSMQEAKDAEMQPKIRKAYEDSKNYKSGGKVSSASKRADGIATKGKTRGTMITMKGGGYAC